MKKYVLLPALFVALSIVSCTKDQIEPIQDSPDKAEARAAINTVSNSFLTGSWQISYVLTSGGDITSNFKDCAFSFGTNGSLLCKGEVGTSIVGKWVVSFVDGKTRVTFSFLSNSGFEAMNGDWTTMDGSTNEKIVMHGALEQKNYLTLEKR